MSLLLDLVLFAAGLAILLKGADWATERASRIAGYFGVSNVIIGLSLLAISTSLPELAVSVTAAFAGSGGIALGNVVGSNIANIGLVLGLSVLILPLLVDKGNMEEAVILFVLLVISAIYMLDGISRLEGVFLLLFMFVYLYDLFKYGEQRIQRVRPGYDIRREFLYFAVGIAGVVIGSRFLVSSTVSIAAALHISEVVIAVTVIAVGTSLPELTVSLSAARKGFKDMALGNIVGSCMFNIAAVLGASALIAPIVATRRLVIIDMPFMLLMAGLLLVFMRSNWEISRKEGFVFLLVYVLFLALQFLRV